MTSSLVGSEMCIRDRTRVTRLTEIKVALPARDAVPRIARKWYSRHPVSYTHLTLPTICSV
eukprot:12687721-Prorocentrum_lima.AAC.1